MSTGPADNLARRRQDFDDAMQALELPESCRLALRAAASAWAKAAAVSATASYIDARRADAEPLGPN